MLYGENLTEGLSGDLRRIADVAGIEAAIKIGVAFKGTYLYIRGVDKLMRLVRDMKIRKEYESGSGTKRLSRRYRLTERQIKNILGTESEGSLPRGIERLLEE
jgi:Mor family transcriptional regulator